MRETRGIFLLKHLKLLIPWLSEARHLWRALLVIIFAIIVTLILGPTEKVIRLTGLVLQILGIVSVVVGIEETRALYGHMPLWTAVKSWFQRFPLRKRSQSVSSSAHMNINIFGKARARSGYNAPPNATTEERIEVIEKNMMLIREEIDGVHRELDKELSKINDALGVEISQREKEDKDIRKLLEVTATGGIHISLMGTIWLFVGVVLSTAAMEISSFFKG